MSKSSTMSSSLAQYIDLFRATRSTVEATSPAVLNARRPGALAVLEQLGRLPGLGDEGFPVVSLDEMFAPDFGLNLARLPIAVPPVADSSGCLPEKILSGLPDAYLVDDTFVATPRPLPPGVVICSLAEAAARFPDAFSRPVAPASNPLVALNDLFVQDGVFIRIAPGASVPRPLRVLSVFSSGEAPVMAVRRIVVSVGSGASASLLLCDHPSPSSASRLALRVVEADVDPSASLSLYDLEEASPASSRASVFASVQGADSSLNLCSISLGGGVTRNEFYPSFLAQGASVRLGGLVVADASRRVDNFVSLVHSCPRCVSEQLFKYALFDSARASFEGMVRVDPGAEFTDARQSNRNLLASPSARMYAMPQLEIYCDEVRASHGSATGQLDPRALFYMRQRGIPEAEARMMLICAFMTDVLAFISDEPLRERLRHLVDRRLRGADAVCASCH